MRLADAPGNVRITRRISGLPNDSVVNVSQLITLEKQMLTENVGRLHAQSLRDVEAGIKLALAL
jgi:mRNA interferase MazF